jgi:hypothetical protein
MRPRKKKQLSTALERQLSQLEEHAAERGVHIHYDRLEAEGLKLKDGICKLDGAYHIFVDRRKSMGEKIDIIRECLDEPVSEVPDATDE